MTNWKETTLGEVVEIIDGDRGVNYPKNHEFMDKGYCLFLNTKNVPNASFSFDDKMFITKEKDSMLRKGKLKRGDFVLTTRGTIGNYALYSEKVPFENVRINSGMVILRTRDVIDKGFFNFYLKSYFFDNQVISLSSGTAQPQLPIKDLTVFKILLPPLPEQKAIAAVLSSFDDKIELLRRQNKTLESIAQAIFKEWFVNFTVNGKKLKIDPKTDLPVGWRMGTLEDFIEIYGGGTPKTDITEYWNGNIPWFSVVDTPDECNVYAIKCEKCISQSGLENSSTKILPINTTIITARGTVGKLALTGVPMAMNQSCYGLTPKDGKSFFFYLFFLIKASLSALKQQVHGAVFDTITRDTLINISVTIPPDKMVDCFENAATPCFHKILQNNFQIQTLSKLRDLLLPKLMKGDIRVKYIGK